MWLGSETGFEEIEAAAEATDKGWVCSGGAECVDAPEDTGGASCTSAVVDVGSSCSLSASIGVLETSVGSRCHEKKENHDDDAGGAGNTGCGVS